MTIIIFLVASILIMSLLNIISQNEFKREFRNLTSNTNDSIKMYNEKIIEISKENSILKSIEIYLNPTIMTIGTEILLLQSI